MENNEYYSVRDLYLASFLYSKGIKLAKTEKIGNVYWFQFEEKDVCEKLTSQYWANEAETKAKSMTDAMRTLKDIIFS